MPDVAGTGTGDQRGQAACQQAIIDHHDLRQGNFGELRCFYEAIWKRFFSDTGNETHGGKLFGEPLSPVVGRFVGEDKNLVPAKNCFRALHPGNSLGKRDRGAVMRQDTVKIERKGGDPR